LYDRSIDEYETILTPRDFERAEQLGNPPHYNKYDLDDPDAMYKKDLFEGDIANENAKEFFEGRPRKVKLSDLNASTVEMFLNGGVGNSNGGWYNAIKNRHQCGLTVAFLTRSAPVSNSGIQCRSIPFTLVSNGYRKRTATSIISIFFPTGDVTLWLAK
ncbi:hypothetical protein COOONC_24065, partial [Cooperia oncophora]